jgi:glucosamine-6-phosphate deaminase
MMPKNYYSIPAEDFHKHSRVDFHFVQTHDDLCQAFAREVVDLMKANLALNQMTKIILPIGPYDFHWLAELCNREPVSCESLVIFSMDQYVDENGRAFPINSPLSFRGYYENSLVQNLDRDKRIPPEQIIMPDPQDLDLVQRKLEQYGAIDVTYGGAGIDGHYAFNYAPQDREISLDEFTRTTVHLLDLPDSFVVQMAMGGTGGNLEIVPTRGCSLGIKELLSAKMLHLPFLRSWHAGVLRRALFGPVTPKFPITVVQLHPNVKATITAAAAALPAYDHLQSVSKQA